RPHGAGAMRGSARSTVPLRVRRRAGRPADRDRLDEARDGRRDHTPPRPRPGLAPRGPAQRVVVAVGLVDVGGGVPAVESLPADASAFVVASPVAAGLFGRGFVPMRTMVGSLT